MPGLVAGHCSGRRIRRCNNYRSWAKPLQEQQQVDAETLSTFALGLRQKLQRQGDDPIAWWIYAGLMTDLQQFDQANNAFERSLKLDPDRVGTLISYARFLLQNGGADANQKAAQLLARVLRPSRRISTPRSPAVLSRSKTAIISRPLMPGSSCCS